MTRPSWPSRSGSIALLAAIGLLACGKRASSPAGATRDAATTAAPVAAPPAIDAAAAMIDAARVKAALDAVAQPAAVAEACLVVRAPDGTLGESDATRCAERLTPASTFKLPNALIGADVGLLDGPDAVMTYDGRRYPRQSHWPPAWAKDQPLREALEVSAVPLFQRLATQIGQARMQAHLDAMKYGNQSTAGGIDRFWLSGGLAISAREQIDFLTGLAAGTLPVSAKAHDVVRAAAPSETAGGAVLHWKTGTSARDDAPAIGWLVGWIERPDGVHTFACWIKGPPSGDMTAFRDRRIAVCRGALDRLGLFPAPPA